LYISCISSFYRPPQTSCSCMWNIDISYNFKFLTIYYYYNQYWTYEMSFLHRYIKLLQIERGKNNSSWRTIFHVFLGQGLENTLCSYIGMRGISIIHSSWRTSGGSQSIRAHTRQEELSCDLVLFVLVSCSVFLCGRESG